jgi:hypothetical protein
MDQTPAMSNACYAVQQIYIQCNGKDCHAHNPGIKILRAAPQVRMCNSVGAMFPRQVTFWFWEPEASSY